MCALRWPAVFGVAWLLPLAIVRLTFAAAPDPPRPIDESRVRAAGIRKLESKRLTLYTDVPASPAVDELPAVFDQAFPQWCAYFGVETGTHASWRMTGYLIKEKLRFEAAGLIPADLPEFLNGYCRRYEFWLNDQTSDYYRRHLLLHEGTHGFMFTVLKGGGPPWYAEGMAELLATHRWQRGRLQLNRFPASAADVSKLGRIELVQKDFAANRGRKFAEVLAYDSLPHLKVEPYAWSWAAAAFLDNHPRYRDRFRELWRLAGDRDFNERLAEKFAADGRQLVEEFQVFAADLDYGYDFSRTMIDFTPGKLLGGPNKNHCRRRSRLAKLRRQTRSRQNLPVQSHRPLPSRPVHQTLDQRTERHLAALHPRQTARPGARCHPPRPCP